MRDGAAFPTLLMEKPKPRLAVRATALAFAAVAAWTAPAATQESGKYPEKPITMIVPFAAGGPTDIVARIVGEHIQKTLGQPIIVENVAGANGLRPMLSKEHHLACRRKFGYLAP